MQYRCIIVDDEPPAIKVLENHIKFISQLGLVGVCRNAFEAINLLTNENIELVFLDINMPKLTGTELIKTLKYCPKIIFTTAHKDFAIEAFELGAVDYLVKPISFERFVKSVNKVLELHPQEKNPLPSQSSFVYFRADRKMVKVFLDDILYVECFKDYIVIHSKEEKKLRIKQSLNSIENILPKNQFSRIHRSFIVSIDKITAFTKTDIEIEKIELPIGKSYEDVFKQFTTDISNLPDGVEDR